MTSTSPLGTGKVGIAYSAQLGATGGRAPYIWTLNGGTLPAGLALSSSGQISGSATSPGSSTFTVKVSDSAGRVTASVFTISISPGALVISTSALANGQVGVSYSATLAAAGGTTPFAWSLASGTFPPGLSLNASTGSISGTPTGAVNATPLTFKVTDSESPAVSATSTLTLTVAPPPTLQITTTSLSNGSVGTPYSASLVATGGLTPYNWTLVSGTLPAGLGLNAATGVINGTPTSASNATSLTFRVTDSESPAISVTAILPLTIAGATAPLQVTTTSLPGGTVGLAYNASLAATGGQTPYAWSLSSGTLPAGISLNASTGALSGTPTTAVNATPLTFKVTDSSSPGVSAIATLSLTVAASTSALQITTTALADGTVGTAYSFAVAASGGTTPYTWALTGGTLPAGLSLNASTGAINGTPTAAANATSLTFKVTDSGVPAAFATATLSLTITASAPALQITTTSLPAGTVGTAYSATLAATGGKAPYSWTLTSGTLPAGLALNASTGAVSGTPTAAANGVSLNFKVTDSESPAVSKTVALSLTVASGTLRITTTSLPNGTVNSAYSVSLAASGGTTPYTWTLTSGTLPAGLSLNASTGVISGTATATANATLTFKVTDASSPAQSQSANLSLTISASSSVSVTVAPGVAVVNFTKSQQFMATVTGSSNTSVNWFVDNIAGGSSSAGTISSSGLYTPPSVVGSHTVTAISAANSNATASATVYISHSPGVFTYHNDNLRTGLNASETVLTPSNVNAAQFGKLFSLPVDGQLFAQPLYVPSLTINSQVHNVLFVATQHDSVYAWDADTASTTPLWKTSFINPGAGVTTVPCANAGSGDCTTIYPEFGITSTPVIDSATGTLYVVAITKEISGSTTNYVYRLHALSLATGAEKFGGPVVIQANVSGVIFNPKQHLQRPGLLLVNGVVYVGFGSHGDAMPYYGWLLGYNASNLQQVLDFNAAPNAKAAAIWQSGCAPAVDANGDIYFITGNGGFTANTGGVDYGDTVLKLNPNGTVPDYFTPTDQSTLNVTDLDLGSGGHVLLPDQGGTFPHLLITAGKQGIIYVLNRDNMGRYSTVSDTSLQSLSGLAGPLFGSPAFWNGYVYFAPWNDTLRAFHLNNFTLTASSNSMTTLGFPGATPSVSANGNNNGVVWIIQADVPNDTVLTSVPNAVLRAYSATNVATELYNSSQSTNDTAGGAVKFAVPTVADGKVFVGNSNQVTVYGLLP